MHCCHVALPTAASLLLLLLQLLPVCSGFLLPLLIGGAAWDAIGTQGSPLDSLSMTAGDVVRCNLRRGIAFDHWMLALNATHMIGTSYNHIRIQAFSVQRGYDRESCFNDGPGPLGRSESVRRAIAFADRQIHYDLIYCNCQHFVRDWAFGSSGAWYENQSLQSSSPDCEV